MAARRKPTLSTLKDHAFLTDLFIEIEDRFPINEMKHYGVHLWPLVRLQLGRSFKNSDMIADAGLGEAYLSKKLALPAREVFSALPQNRDQRSSLMKAHSTSVREDLSKSQRRVLADWQFAEDVEPPDFAVLTKLEKYYKQTDQGHYAPILDPISEDLEKYGSVQRLTLEPFPLKCLHQPIALDMSGYLATHQWERKQPDKAVLLLLEEIVSYAEQRWPEWPISSKQIFNRLERIRARRDYFYEVFRRLRPGMVVLSSFTGWMHALWACKDLAIPVVDVQHGGQGPIHFPSTHYSRFPLNGYHFLPDVFWLWGEYNRQFAQPWNPGAASYRHIPIVGGHRGVAKWKSQYKDGLLPELDQAFIRDNAQANCVLITLSYALDPLMPNNLFELIKQRPNLRWLIRLHPIHRSTLTRDQIVNKLQQIGANDFVIDEVTDVQLQTALFVSKYHITPFSTSVREAQAFGVASVFCHETAATLFQSEIESGQIAYSSDVQELCELVDQAVQKSHRMGINVLAIQTDIAGVEEVIKTAKKVQELAPRLQSEALKNPSGVFALDDLMNKPKSQKRTFLYLVQWLRKFLNRFF